jgi:predicted Zn-dependent protease
MIAGQKDTMLMTLAGLALAVLASRSHSSSSGDATQAAVAATQAAAIQQQINFTRENEYEADRIGFQRLDAAGFDVNGMATFMEASAALRAFRSKATCPVICATTR